MYLTNLNINLRELHTLTQDNLFLSINKTKIKVVIIVRMNCRKIIKIANIKSKTLWFEHCR